MAANSVFPAIVQAGNNPGLGKVKSMYTDFG